MEKRIYPNFETLNTEKVKLVGAEWKTEPNRLAISFGAIIENCENTILMKCNGYV